MLYFLNELTYTLFIWISVLFFFPNGIDFGGHVMNCGAETLLHSGYCFNEITVLQFSVETPQVHA